MILATLALALQGPPTSAPTHVVIGASEMPLADVLADLSRQCGIPCSVADGANPPISLDRAELPLLEALDRIAAASQMTWTSPAWRLGPGLTVRADEDGIAFRPGAAGAIPLRYAGPVRIGLRSVSRTWTLGGNATEPMLTVALSPAYDPSVAVLAEPEMTIEAVTDTGQVLERVAEPRGRGHRFRAASVVARALRIRGRVRLRVPTRVETADLPESGIQEHSGYALGERTVTLRQVDRGDRFLEFWLRIDGGPEFFGGLDLPPDLRARARFLERTSGYGTSALARIDWVEVPPDERSLLLWWVAEEESREYEFEFEEVPYP